MALDEQMIATVLRLLPDRSTISSLQAAPELHGVSIADIKAALVTLEERGQISAAELFAHDIPSEGI
jgi:hypothetical protein